MIFKIKYIDSKKNVHYLIEDFSNLAILKHMVIAGQGYMPSFKKIRRVFGIYLYYYEYIHKNDGRSFNMPVGFRNDPTEKGQFSNLVGKAIADLLSKRINNVLITFNYEEAIRRKGYKLRNQKRPDLLCYSSNASYAIEAKGFSSTIVSEKSMNKHKLQSSCGPIKTDYSIASVAYNLYSEVKVNYYDPPNEQYIHDVELYEYLMRNYFYGILEYVEQDILDVSVVNINDSDFYKITLDFNKIFGVNFIEKNECQISFLICRHIDNIIRSGFTQEYFVNNYYYSSENIFIDVDGVGLMLE